MTELLTPPAPTAAEDLLAVLREQVLDRGVGLTLEQAVACLEL
ncbi:MAG: hypothetical protein JWN08_3728, partial [Frankiales bacterium]|nr:hypothetical protein [Frankiales bacterium]